MSMRPGSRSKAGGLATGRTLIVVAIALLLGALILKRAWGNDTPKVTTNPDGSVTETTTKGSGNAATSVATTIPIVTTTTVPLNLATNKVLVANGAGIDGIAGRVTAEIQKKGYVPQLPATNANAAVPLTAIYYNPTPGADRVARFVAADLGLPATVVAAMPATKPVKDLATANVLVVLGQDFKEAGILKTSSVQATAAAPVTTAAVAVTPAPAVTTPTTKKP